MISKKSKKKVLTFFTDFFLAKEIRTIKWVFEDSPEPIILIDYAGKLIWQNNASSNIKKIIGQDILEVLKKNSEWPPIYNTIKCQDFECVVTWGSNRLYYILTVHPQRQKDESLMLAERLLHDIKSHFSGAISLLSLIEEADEEDATNYIKLVSDDLRETMKNINGFLSVSRLEKGVGTVNKEELNLLYFISRNKEKFERIYGDKGIDLIINLDFQIKIWADKNLLNIAVDNLLRNAAEEIMINNMINNSLNKKISIFCQKKDAEIEITVANPGTISDENLAKIFRERFSTKSGGNGLGTSAIRIIAEAHGGSASARCQDGMVYVTMTFPA